MTNLEIATELSNKSVADLCEIANLTGDLIIDTWTELAQSLLQNDLAAEGIEVSAMCGRKKAPPSA